MVNIRAARVNDAVAIYEVHVSSIQKICSTRYNADQIQAWVGEKRPENYVRAMERGEQIIVAEDEREIAGFGGILVNEKTITAIYVHPSFVGKGTGLKILTRLEEIAKKAELDYLNLLSTLNAVSFYEAAGFHKKKSARYSVQGETELECVHMIKELYPQSTA